MTVQTMALFQDRAIKKGWRKNLWSDLKDMEMPHGLDEYDYYTDVGSRFYASVARLIETGPHLGPEEVDHLYNKTFPLEISECSISSSGLDSDWS